jgi:hypothetical protein
VAASGKLSAVQVKSIKKPARYYDGGNLALVVRASGRKTWEVDGPRDAKAKKGNPRRPTAKLRNGKPHPAFGFVSLEIIRKTPGQAARDHDDHRRAKRDCRSPTR